MPTRSCFSHSCELNSVKYLSEEWNLLQETRKILGYFQDTTYNHRCLANSFLLLQSLYSLKMALSIFFCLCSLHVCSVSFEEKKEKKREIVLSILAQVPQHSEAFITNPLQRQAAMQTFLTLSVWRAVTGPPAFPEDGWHPHCSKHKRSTLSVRDSSCSSISLFLRTLGKI